MCKNNNVLLSRLKGMNNRHCAGENETTNRNNVIYTVIFTDFISASAATYENEEHLL